MENKDPVASLTPPLSDDVIEYSIIAPAFTSALASAEALESFLQSNSQKLRKALNEISGEGNDSGEYGDQRTEENKVEVEGKTDDGDPDIDRSVSLIPELNYLTWPQWRKLRVSEYEGEKFLGFQRKERMKKRKTTSKKFVIDLVVDMGDVAHTENSATTKRSRVPCRIRINSQHILDALNEITNIILPQNCQMLHPFKIIVDHLDNIQGYAKTLEDNLAKAKSIYESKLNQNGTLEVTNGVLPTTGSNGSLFPDERDKSPGKQYDILSLLFPLLAKILLPYAICPCILPKPPKNEPIFYYKW
ncbi:hypothetical protein HD806DRAFT_10349 [Xylariaceae sp. AK1471]|nr:hypothetical protein HD806DRAFT_10349 [Xylariaceae sp. AK1471]